MIVMSVVTAVPFGLGIRDTIRSKQALADARRVQKADAKRHAAELEADARRNALEQQREIAERMAKLAQLIGPKPAQMGPMLEGIELGGAGRFQPEHVRQRIDNASEQGLFEVTIDEDNRSLHVTIGSASEACEGLHKRLVATWGPATNGVWLDAAGKQRAMFDADRCQLEFETYLEPRDWVAAMPFELIGERAAIALSKLPTAEADDNVFYWTLPGVRYGHGDTKLEAYVDQDRVVGIKATVATDFDSMVAVREALNAKLKTKGVADEVTGVWSWKKKSVVLDPFSTDRFYLVIGKIPWD